MRVVLGTLAGLAALGLAAPAASQGAKAPAGDLEIPDPALQELLDELDPMRLAPLRARAGDGLVLEGAPTRLTEGQTAALRIVKCEVEGNGRIDTKRCTEHPTTGANWSVDGIPGGNADTGVLKSRGPASRNAYTAPSQINWYEAPMVSVEVSTPAGKTLLVKTLELLPSGAEWWVGKVSRQVKSPGTQWTWAARVAFPTAPVDSSGEPREAFGAGRRQFLSVLGPGHTCRTEDQARIERGSVIVLDWPQPDGTLQSHYRISVSPDFGTALECESPELGRYRHDVAPAVDAFEFERACTGTRDLGGIAFMPTPTDADILHGTTRCSFPAGLETTMRWILERHPKRPHR